MKYVLFEHPGIFSYKIENYPAESYSVRIARFQTAVYIVFFDPYRKLRIIHGVETQKPSRGCLIIFTFNKDQGGKIHKFCPI